MKICCRRILAFRIVVTKSDVPEVLNVHINEMYKKLTTMKSNKIQLKNCIKKKSHFLSPKLAIHCLKKILLKK